MRSFVREINFKKMTQRATLNQHPSLFFWIWFPRKQRRVGRAAKFLRHLQPNTKLTGWVGLGLMCIQIYPHTSTQSEFDTRTRIITYIYEQGPLKNKRVLSKFYPLFGIPKSFQKQQNDFRFHYCKTRRKITVFQDTHNYF